jgi:hypothetical protein
MYGSSNLVKADANDNITICSNGRWRKLAPNLEEAIFNRSAIFARNVF